MLLPLAFFPFNYWPFEIPKVTLLRLLTIAVLAAWTSRSVIVGEFTIRRPPASLAVLSYLGVFALTTALSISPTTSLFGEAGRNDGLLTIANLVLLYFLTASIMTTPRQRQRCISLMVISATAVSGLGILQYLLPELPVFPSTHGRAFSTLSNPDFLFSYLALVVPITLLACIREPRKYALPLAAMLVAAVMSLPVANRPDEDPPATPQRMIEVAPEQFSGSVFSRLPIWRAALQTVKERPLLGSGPNTLKHTISRYETPDRTKPDYRTDKAHNEFIDVITTMGLVGLAVYLWMLIAIGLFLRQNLGFHRLRTPEGAIASGVLLAFLAYTVQTLLLFHTLVAYTTFWQLMGIAAGIHLSARPSEARWQFTVPRLIRPLLITAGAVVLVWLSFLSVRPMIADMYYHSAELHRQRGGESLILHTLAAEKAARWNGYEWLYNARYVLALSELALYVSDPVLKESMLDTATRHATLAVARSPYDANAYFIRAVVLTRRGEAYRQAVVDDLEKAVEMYPTYFQANYLLATEEKLRGNLERAISARKAALKVLPDEFDVLFELGDDYFKAGKTDLAIRTWEDATKAMPQSAKVAFALGMAYEELNDLGRARSYYLAAHQLNPDYPGVEEAIRRATEGIP